MIVQRPLYSILWTLEIVEFVKKHFDAIRSMRRCMWLSLRLSLWLQLRLNGWGFHVFRMKGEVINIFIGVTTLNSSVLTFYSLFFFKKTTKMSFTPRHCLSRDLVFPLHHWQTGGKFGPSHIAWWTWSIPGKVESSGTSSCLHISQVKSRCKHRCLYPSSRTNHEGTELEEGRGLSDSSLGRGWKSWCMPVFSFQERNWWWANTSSTDLPQALVLSLIQLAISSYHMQEKTLGSLA